MDNQPKDDGGREQRADHPDEVLQTADQRAKTEIQAICNGKLTPIAMQVIAKTRETPPAQEQWGTMERTMGINEKNNARSNGNNEKSGRMLLPIVA
jgi:hypothetical protein